MLKTITTETAVELSKEVKATRLVILAVDDENNWSYAVAGKPGEHEEAVREWAHHNAERVMLEVVEYEPRD